jgi:hypothetical protein
MLAQMLQKQPAVGKTAFMLQAIVLNWLLDVSSIWNIRSTIRFFDKVDPELLRSRMQKVIDRHPALRTTYEVPERLQRRFRSKVFLLSLGRQKASEIFTQAYFHQRVHQQHSADFAVVDARDWTAEQLRERLIQDALEPYKIDALPMCRLRLYQRRNDDVMQMNVHHAAADLWSLELIISELLQPSNEPPPPSFAEFCTWQHAWFALPKALEMRTWWSEYLEGCQPVLLPYTQGSDPAELVLFRLDAELLESARAVCRSHRVTLFNLLLSCMQVSLGRLLGLTDFCISGAMANRPNVRFEETVGGFSSLVLYRRDLSQLQSWEHMWALNRSTISDVMDRQFYPVVTLPLPRMDAYISFHQYRKARWVDQAPEGEPLGLRSGGVVSSPLGPWEFLFVEPPLSTSPFLLEFVEQKDVLQGAVRFRTKCISRQTAELFVQDFMKRFRASLNNPAGAIDGP